MPNGCLYPMSGGHVIHSSIKLQEIWFVYWLEAAEQSTGITNITMAKIFWIWNFWTGSYYKEKSITSWYQQSFQHKAVNNSALLQQEFIKFKLEDDLL